MSNLYSTDLSEYVEHHGIKGMKWGVRRYQNKDGSLTNLGEKHRKQITISPETKKRLKTGLKIVGAVGVAYGTHKLINDKRVIALGTDTIKRLNSKGKPSKTVRYIQDSIKNSTEYKMAAGLGKAMAPGVKAVGGATKKVWSKVTDEKTTNIIKGVAGMASATVLLTDQVRDLRKMAKSDNKDIKAVASVIQKGAEAGVTTLNIAKGPRNSNNQNYNGKNKGGQNSSLASTSPKELRDKLGTPKGISASDEPAYSKLFQKPGITDQQKIDIRAMRKNGWGVDQIEQHVFG